MPNLSNFSVIKTKVQKYRNDFRLTSDSLAFIWVGLETILNLNEDEIEEAITDGSMDGGIDAIYTTSDTVHVFNFKYTDSFQLSKNNFPETEISKLIVTVRGIFEKSIQKTNVNNAIWDKITEIWDLFKKRTLKFKFYLCSNKQKPVARAQNQFETNLKEFRFVEFYYIDQEGFVAKILEKKYKKIDGEIRFIEKQYFERSDGPLKGIVATIAAQDLIELVQNREKPGELIEDVFNENVRVYLKLKNRINRNIYETALSDENYEFWYLNNGITIVCEECTYMPNARSPLVTLKNLQIVNGGQTTHALFEAHIRNPERTNDVLVLVKIYEVKNFKISEKISETTNSQTPVRTRDLHANDRIQRVLEDEFKALGYYYERKKNQYSDYPKGKRLDNELLGQIYMSYYLGMPSEAKNNKALVFGEKYDDIFDEKKITAQKMLLPYKIYVPLERMKKEIQKKKRRKQQISEKDAFISRATFHLLSSVKLIGELEEIDLSDQKNMEMCTKKAIRYINEIVSVVRKQRKDQYTHDKFFKEIPTTQIVQEHIRKKYLL